MIELARHTGDVWLLSMHELAQDLHLVESLAYLARPFREISHDLEHLLNPVEVPGQLGSIGEGYLEPLISLWTRHHVCSLSGSRVPSLRFDCIVISLMVPLVGLKGREPIYDRVKKKESSRKPEVFKKWTDSAGEMMIMVKVDW